MSNTRYTRSFTLRLDADERADLTRAVMGEIERLQPPAAADERTGRRLQRLRAMLDRLSD